MLRADDASWQDVLDYIGPTLAATAETDKFLHDMFDVELKLARDWNVVYASGQDNPWSGDRDLFRQPPKTLGDVMTSAWRKLGLAPGYLYGEKLGEIATTRDISGTGDTGTTGGRSGGSGGDRDGGGGGTTGGGDVTDRTGGGRGDTTPPPGEAAASSTTELLMWAALGYVLFRALR